MCSRCDCDVCCSMEYGGLFWCVVGGVLGISIFSVVMLSVLGFSRVFGGCSGAFSALL